MIAIDIISYIAVAVFAFLFLLTTLIAALMLILMIASITHHYNFVRLLNEYDTFTDLIKQLPVFYQTTVCVLSIVLTITWLISVWGILPLPSAIPASIILAVIFILGWIKRKSL